MEKDKINSLLIDYIDGNLSEINKEEIESLIQSDEEVSKDYVQLKEVMGLMDTESINMPSEHLNDSFEKMLSQELKPKEQNSTSKNIVFKIAAAVSFLLIMSLFIINRIENNREIESLKSELNKTNSVLFELLKDNSTSARLTGANRLGEVKSIDKEIIDALWYTLNFDSNTNVRIAALNAMAKFSEDPKVRKELVRALKFQDNPKVQIALINLLVDLKETSIVNQLNSIVKQDSINALVKDEAQMGIFKLM